MPVWESNCKPESSLKFVTSDGFQFSLSSTRSTGLLGSPSNFWMKLKGFLDWPLSRLTGRSEPVLTFEECMTGLPAKLTCSSGNQAPHEHWRQSMSFPTPLFAQVFQSQSSLGSSKSWNCLVSPGATTNWKLYLRGNLPPSSSAAQSSTSVLSYFSITF